MRYIKKIILEHYQSHKKTIIDFHKGINIIQGETDEGKTSIIRAISGIFYNKPNSPKLIQKNHASYNISIILDDDITIKKTRTKTKNEYYIIYPDGNIHKLEKFRNSLPKILIEILKAPKLIVDKTKEGEFHLNIASQLEGPFLLSSPSTIKPKVLTKLTGGNILDLAVRKNTSDYQKQKQKRDSLEEGLLNLEEQLKKYAYLDNGIEKIDALLNMITKYKELDLKLKDIKKEVDKYNSNEVILKENCNVLNAFKNLDINHIITQIKENDLLTSQYNTIKSDYDSYNLTVKKVDGIERILHKSNNIIILNEKLSEYKNKENIYLNTQKQYTQYISNQNVIDEKILLNNLLIDINKDLSYIKEAINKRESFVRISQFYKDYNILLERIRKGEFYIQKLKPVFNLQEMVTNYIDLYRNLYSIQNNYNHLVHVNNNIDSSNNMYKLLNVVSQLKSSVESFNNKEQTTEVIQNDYEKISKTKTQLKEYNHRIQSLNQQLISKKEEFAQFEICPLCEQSIPH